MAKGVEDTTLYVYNRLLSLNEVGGRPGHFGCTLEEFHHFNSKRRDLWPDSLNAPQLTIPKEAKTRAPE